MAVDTRFPVSVVAVPIMVMMMLLSGNKTAMGAFTLPPILKSVGWIATIVMGVAVIGIFATMGQGG
ncbi:hypothetical protein PX554_25080 [Sphingomonas sp. H39-1-10]|uniref:hypothetical protein n=1 Tax=Sphingomonas pollutisoli TaxID=3030829 RepID=UPI0023B88F5D|nr:hypothetical protein [Sphingomonas pollutisoli]MDF0491394.1 hypothetical protein [Sphingomonas pollutisoli]